MTKHYTYTLIDNKPHIVAENTFNLYYEPFIDEYQKLANQLHANFKEANPPIIWDGPEFEGMKPESEIEFPWQWLNVVQGSEWEDITPAYMDAIIAHYLDDYAKQFRQIARLKEVDYVNEDFFCHDLHYQSIGNPASRCDKQCDMCSQSDLETCTEKEEKVTGETPIQEEETEIDFKKLWGKWWNVVKNDIDKEGYSPGNKQTYKNLGYKREDVEFFHTYSTKWRPIPVQEHKPESEDNQANGPLYPDTEYYRNYNNSL